MDLITLSDLPALAGDARKPRATIPIGRLDDNLRDPRYGKFAITQQMVDSWKSNLTGVFGGQVSLDFDHSSDRGGGTRAAAWVTNITQKGNLVLADVQFTKRGARAVRNGDYRYTSPTFVADYTDEHGQKHGPALIGGALTNRPVLRKGMPTLSLSRDDFDGVELAKVSKKVRKKTATLRGKGKPEFPMPDKLRARANGILGKGKAAKKSALSRDSRGQTMELTREDLATALGLPADADSDAILAGVCVTLASVPASPSHTPGVDAPASGHAGAKAAGKAALGSKKAFKKSRKAARQNATLSTDDDGTVTLSAEQLAELITGANAGAAAAKQLADDRFANAYNTALSEGRVAPSQEETLKLLHAKDPDLALKTLASFVPIVPVRPTGSGDPGASTGPAPSNMDADRFQLHHDAKQLAQQKRTSNPDLSEEAAYEMAVFEIDERNFQLSNPGI